VETARSFRQPSECHDKQQEHIGGATRTGAATSNIWGLEG
jgi:hypothetical protein